MKKNLTSSKVYIDESNISEAGRGVFAKLSIKKGELIESCPVIEVLDEAESLNPGILVTYFYYSDKNKDLALLALGFGSIYNHSYTPNAKYMIKEKDQIINFIAIDDIKKGEEITVNYKGEGSKNNKPLWFEIVNNNNFILTNDK